LKFRALVPRDLHIPPWVRIYDIVAQDTITLWSLVIYIYLPEWGFMAKTRSRLFFHRGGKIQDCSSRREMSTAWLKTRPTEDEAARAIAVAYIIMPRGRVTCGGFAFKRWTILHTIKAAMVWEPPQNQTKPYIKEK
jgi:hypothetical protein